MKKLFRLLLVILPVITFYSCSEEDDTWDPYYNWQARNEAWYDQIADSARTAIAQAKAQYGDAWEDHCDWRMFKSLLKAQDYDTGITTDTVCVRIHARGTGDVCPNYNDTVRLSYRGWLMDTEYENDEGVKYNEMSVFSQTYYGVFNSETAAPSLMSASALVEGFNTALQYMVAGDDWYIYIPHQLGYGANASDAIPAYSTLLFRVNLAAVYPVNSGVPDWKVKGESY